MIQNNTYKKQTKYNIKVVHTKITHIYYTITAYISNTQICYKNLTNMIQQQYIQNSHTYHTKIVHNKTYKQITQILHTRIIHVYLSEFSKYDTNLIQTKIKQIQHKNSTFRNHTHITQKKYTHNTHKRYTTTLQIGYSNHTYKNHTNKKHKQYIQKSQRLHTKITHI